MMISDVKEVNGGGGFSTSSPVTQSVVNPVMPVTTQAFDLSPIAGLKSSQKYQGNLVSDITSAYQTYITGNPTGRGGQYAVSAQKKYGYTSIRDAAAAYLQAAGLNFIPPATIADSTVTNTVSNTTQTNPTDGGTTTTTPKTNLETLADIFKSAFGNAIYNPPLQNQAYGYTPVSTSAASGTGGSSIMVYIVIAAIAFGVYYFWKHRK